VKGILPFRWEKKVARDKGQSTKCGELILKRITYLGDSETTTWSCETVGESHNEKLRIREFSKGRFWRSGDDPKGTRQAEGCSRSHQGRGKKIKIRGCGENERMRLHEQDVRNGGPVGQEKRKGKSNLVKRPACEG